LRRDLLSFGSAFGEPVTAPHVVHTWPSGWMVGSIGGDAPTCVLAAPSPAHTGGIASPEDSGFPPQKDVLWLIHFVTAGPTT